MPIAQFLKINCCWLASFRQLSIICWCLTCLYVKFMIIGNPNFIVQPKAVNPVIEPYCEISMSKHHYFCINKISSCMAYYTLASILNNCAMHNKLPTVKCMHLHTELPILLKMGLYHFIAYIISYVDKYTL